MRGGWGACGGAPGNKSPRWLKYTGSGGVGGAVPFRDAPPQTGLPRHDGGAGPGPLLAQETWPDLPKAKLRRERHHLAHLAHPPLPLAHPQHQLPGHEPSAPLPRLSHPASLLPAGLLICPPLLPPPAPAPATLRSAPPARPTVICTLLGQALRVSGHPR